MLKEPDSQGVSTPPPRGARKACSGLAPHPEAAPGARHLISVAPSGSARKLVAHADHVVVVHMVVHEQNIGATARMMQIVLQYLLYVVSTYNVVLSQSGYCTTT